jgi:hypothetical protein
MHDVFISHSRTHNRDIADAVVAALEAAVVRCWIAPRDIKVGEDFASAIVQAIATTRVLVLIFSSHANSSIHIRREVDAALRTGAIVVPFRVENVMPEGALAYHLQSLQWLDALTPDINRHIQELVRAVKSELARASSPRTPTTDFGLPTPIAPHPAFKPVSGTYPTAATRATGEMPIGAAPSPVLAKMPKRRRTLPSRNVLAGVGVAAFAALVVTRLAMGSEEVVGVPFEYSGEQGGSGQTMKIVADNIRFFEGSSKPPALAARQYQEVFASAQTRFIYTELTFSYAAPGQAVTLPVNCAITAPGKTVVGQFVLESTLPAGSTKWINARAWGRAAPGGWAKGAYRVECAVGDVLVARSVFEIED